MGACLARRDLGDLTAIFLDINDTARSSMRVATRFRWIEAGYDAGILDVKVIAARATCETDLRHVSGQRVTMSRICRHRAAMIHPAGRLCVGLV